MKTSALLVLALGAFCVNAEDTPVDVEDSNEDSNEDISISTEDEFEEEVEINTNYFFPSITGDDFKFPVGKEATVLVDVANNGQDVFNVTAIALSLHSPYDLSYFIQNFTFKELAAVAAPNTQISLEYKFKPDEKLEALEYWLSGRLEYTVEGSGELYEHVFINKTVHLFEDKAGVDIINAFLTLLMVVTIAGLLFGAFTLFAPKVGLTKKKKKYVPPAASAAPAEWEVDSYSQSQKARPAGRRKRVSKQEKK